VTIPGEHPWWKLRARLVVLLASSATFLFLLNLASEKMASRRSAERPTDQTALKDLDEMVVRTLTRLGVEQKNVRTRNVQTPNNVFSRVERKVQVPAEFPVLRFNQALGEDAALYNASVIGTERTKERQTSIHVVWKGKIVQTVVLISR